MSSLLVRFYIHLKCINCMDVKIQEETCNGAISVELWVRQVVTPGPFEPDVIQINSVNRMLVDKGVVLPIRKYVKPQFEYFIF